LKSLLQAWIAHCILLKVERDEVLVSVDGKEYLFAIGSIDKANIEPSFENIASRIDESAEGTV
jgi:hypothetical protein